MKLVVRMQRCEGCGRLSHGRGGLEWCIYSERMERQRPVYYYHRFVSFVFGVAVALMTLALHGWLGG